MAAQVHGRQAGALISPERLAEELAQHGRSPVTWLAGAGLGAAAGLPLSRELWQLLAIFWLRQRRETGGAPAQLLRQLLQGARGLLPLEPHEERAPGAQEPLREDLLRALAELRDRSGAGAQAALSLGGDETTLSRVLQLAAPTPESRRLFLAGVLSQRASGPALAHLLLAALLAEPRGLRSHTVFTVGFDDLLLEALLWLRKPARVFGDGPGRDRPQLVPSATQIVHLHGRSAAYRLLPEPQELLGALAEHLRESSLVVVGYRGADDPVLAVLRRALRTGELAGGLYWVLHRAEQADEVVRRLGGDELPWERVRLVARPHGALGADELLVTLAAQLLPPGGLAAVAEEAARRSGRQRALRQLARAFPAHDPVAEHLRARHEPIGETARQRHLLLAAELARAGGVPEWRAQVRMAEMRDHAAAGRLLEALLCAEAARAAAEEADEGPGVRELRWQTLGLCGELALRLLHLDLGRRHLAALCRDGACPGPWRDAARDLLAQALLRAARADLSRDGALLLEIRALLELAVDAPLAAVRGLMIEAELYLLTGDLRRAALVYESADEMAGRLAVGLRPGDAVLPPTGALAFAAPDPGDADGETALLLCARQARFGLLRCHLEGLKDADTLSPGLLPEVERFLASAPLSDSEGQWMAAELLLELAARDRSHVRRAEEHADLARRLLGGAAPPWEMARVLRAVGRVALLAGRLEEAERSARAALRCAQRARQHDEEARCDLLLAEILVGRARRSEGDRPQLLRRAAAQAERAWLQGAELGLVPLVDEADELLGSLRAAPDEIIDDVTPVP